MLSHDRINSLGDLHSLAKFLRIDGGLSHAGVFKRSIGRNTQNLQAFMLQFCLRRTKIMKFVNLKIPEKQEHLVRLKFSDSEWDKYKLLYDDAREAAQVFFRAKKRGEADLSLWNTVLERLLRMRQMCDHWSLCRKKEIVALFRRQMQDESRQFSTEALSLRGTLIAFVEASTPCGVCGDPLDPGNQPVLTPSCKHGFCENCLDSRLEGQVETKCPLCNADFDPGRLAKLDRKEVAALDKKDGGPADDEEEEPPEHQMSTKVKGILHEISDTLRSKKSKVVIFSQWTSFLDILQWNLENRGLGFTRIDGTMSTEERDAAIKTLESSRAHRIMLASLRVAGVGISLVAADTVIMADTCKLASKLSCFVVVCGCLWCSLTFG
jgi:SWI/SNF-related matrix-associated actin-dependent regulator of chromatin subfamily A3